MEGMKRRGENTMWKDLLISTIDSSIGVLLYYSLLVFLKTSIQTNAQAGH